MSYEKSLREKESQVSKEKSEKCNELGNLCNRLRSRNKELQDIIKESKAESGPGTDRNYLKIVNEN